MVSPVLPTNCHHFLPSFPSSLHIFIEFRVFPTRNFHIFPDFLLVPWYPMVSHGAMVVMVAMSGRESLLRMVSEGDWPCGADRLLLRGCGDDGTTGGGPGCLVKWWRELMVELMSLGKIWGILGNFLGDVLGERDRYCDIDGKIPVG